MTRSRRAPRQYYALVIPGIEDLAGAELRAAGCSVADTLRGFDRRESVVLFESADVTRAMSCTLVEDIFAVVSDRPTPDSRRGAKDIAADLEREAFDQAALTHHALRPKRHGRTYKVVARVSGRHAFHRDDVGREVARAVAAMLPRWREAATAAVEVWAHVIGPRTIVGLRLSGDDMAQRSWKRAHVPASLKPTVARALVLLGEPRAGDVFLDPMCGAGTIVRERAAAARATAVLGGDIAPAMLDASRTNAGRRARLALWDARRLPLTTGCIDAITTNPPYGRQHDATPGIARLYRDATREMARVLKPGGRCVILTGEAEVLSKALPDTLIVRARRRMLVRGLPVTAFVMVRT